jgi:hypothetical protein
VLNRAAAGGNPPGRGRRAGGNPPGRGRRLAPRPKGRRRRLARRVTAVAVGVVIVTAGVVVVPALTAPGNDSIAARLAESARDHGLGFIVTGMEAVQYRLNPPRSGGTLDPSALHSLAADGSNGTRTPKGTQTATPRTRSKRSSPRASTVAATVSVQPAILPPASPALPGEGSYVPEVWVRGQPALQVALLRPDVNHTSYLAGVAWMSTALLRFVQHPGSTDPGPVAPWAQPATVAASARVGLAATFNSAFKIADARGAFYQDGHTAGRFRTGAASLVVDDTGRVSIGAWGRDVTMSPHVRSVRQNLDLLVDGGALSAGITGDSRVGWGATVGSASFVWRSGIGVTAAGDVVFAAGDALSARSLAVLLQRAGAVRAMELDINKAWVSFMWYSPTAGASPTPHKLVAFDRPADRYYTVNNRDFFAVYAR